MICTPYDWLNKFYNFYMAAAGIDVALELKLIVKINLIGVIQCYINC